MLIARNVFVIKYKKTCLTKKKRYPIKLVQSFTENLAYFVFVKLKKS